jgi:hypothetical protein
MSGVKDGSGGVSKVTKTFQEEANSIGNMHILLKNRKDMVGADRSNRNFNVSNTDGKDLKDVNGEKEKSGANGSVDSGGNEISGDKSKTISGGRDQSSGEENNFFGGSNSTGGFRDGNDGINKKGNRDGGISDVEANGSFNEFFGVANGQREKFVAEGDSRGVLNRSFGGENHRDRDAEDSKRKNEFRDGRDRDGGDGQDRDRDEFRDEFYDGFRDGNDSKRRDGLRDDRDRDGGVRYDRGRDGLRHEGDRYNKNCDDRDRDGFRDGDDRYDRK